MSAGSPCKVSELYGSRLMLLILRYIGVVQRATLNVVCFGQRSANGEIAWFAVCESPHCVWANKKLAI